MNNSFIEQIFLHYKRIWKFEYYQIYQLTNGPMRILFKEFSILVIPPYNDRNMWTYATLGMSLDSSLGMELHMFSKFENKKLIEILTAIAYYHMTEKTLSLNDTVNFGIPWQEGSQCDYGLISLPYLDGSDLENLGDNIKFYWLIPITEAERNYRWHYGVEKLEQLFEDKNFNYLDFYRYSVV
ncbi:suppressor of fused domain protein [Volucribacter amazonae]|uniref:Suppressor of fused-like domain-containing protein n=1 Tax=Volucribacter amazonae TaxID=256731 RepID=A0A9X4SR53_9PAST|nr:suppressor of fused domain protein [Volucribacter amazonae]MDG6896186.1 hypothetical protein [Volucribacter amazonae]